MKHITLKPKKHLVLFQLSTQFSPDVVQDFVTKINAATDGNLKFIMTQEETEVTVLTIED